MARITVEDCLEKIDSQYDLVLLAKERTSQLNAGDLSLVPKEDDKNTVISLREIGEGKISIKTLEDSAINRLRKQQEETSDVDELEEEQEDDFDKIYKGEVSKSGTAVLPSKRLRRIPEKVNIIAKSLNSEEVKSLESEEVQKEENKAE
tara:strand:+ start:199 stop:645 length:447 start_codon:yes stop_codon:yes gene_type:complete